MTEMQVGPIHLSYNICEKYVFLLTILLTERICLGRLLLLLGLSWPGGWEVGVSIGLDANGQVGGST